MKLENYINRFHRNYIEDENGCWIWQRSCSPQGYASLKLIMNGVAFYGNRVPYVLFNGPIPDSLIIRHRCDVPSCVNPAHLTLGTKQDNSNDMVERGRSLTCGKRGITEQIRGKNRRNDNWQAADKNWQAKLDWATVRKIREETGTLHQIKAKYGISVSQVHRIRNNLSWVE